MDRVNYEGKSNLTSLADWFLTPARVALGGRVYAQSQDDGAFGISTDKTGSVALRVISGAAAFTVLLPFTAVAWLVRKRDTRNTLMARDAYQAVFQQNGGKPRVGKEKEDVPEVLGTEPPNPLQRHVKFFREGEDSITKASIAEKLMALGLEQKRAETSGKAIQGVLAQHIYKCPFHHLAVSTIHRGVHPMDSGVYHKDGTINEEAWEQIKSWDDSKSGALNKRELDRMLKNNEERDKYRGGNKIWARGGRGEWELLLELFADAEEEVGGEKLPAISFGRLRDFLTKGDELFAELEKALAPA